MEYLTAQEVAVKLKTPERTVQYWCKNGLMEAEKKGSLYLIHEETLLKFRRPKLGRPRLGRDVRRSQ